MRIIPLLFLFFLLLLKSNAQNYSVQIVSEGTKSDLRGLSVLNDSTAWSCGSHGWVAQTSDGGKTWQFKQIPGFETLDFRDIKVFSSKTVVLSNAGSPAHIFRTDDGGLNWRVVYTNNDSLAFIDAFDFWDDKNGIAMADPIGGYFMILTTNDGGNTWTSNDKLNSPKALKGEAAFAASGSCLRTFGTNSVYIVTGGKVSRLLISKDAGKTWTGSKLPILQGTSPQGTFSIAVKNEKTLFISGGDYQKDTLRKKNYFYTLDAGKTWKPATRAPFGYRSCIEIINDSTLITTGDNGTDISANAGKAWDKLDTSSYNTISLSPDKKTIFLCGKNGKIGKVKISENNPDVIAIEQVMDMQVKSWNEGKIEQYMQGYWNSDSLSFIGKNGVTKGWKATLERYKKAYPDKATMGKLTFTLLQKEKLGNENYLVVGQWHLQREKDEVGGHFSLVWKKIKGKWYIISDHTS